MPGQNSTAVNSSLLDDKLWSIIPPALDDGIILETDQLQGIQYVEHQGEAFKRDPVGRGPTDCPRPGHLAGGRQGTVKARRLVDQRAREPYVLTGQEYAHVQKSCR